MSNLFNREKIINSVKPKEFLLALKRNKDDYSFFDGDGQFFSILHGTHYIEKREDGYYSNYNNELKKVSEFENSILLNESLFWRLVNFEALPESVVNELKSESSYYKNPENINSFLKRNGNAICWLFADIIERGTFKRRVLIF